MRSHRPSFRALTAVVAALAVLAVACGSVGSYAAQVDGRRISEDALVAELRSIASNARYLKLIEGRQPVRGTGQGTFDAAFTALALTRQIYYTLIGTELRRRKLTVGRPDLDAARPVVVDQLQGEDVFKGFPASYQEDLVRRQAELDLLTLSVNTAGSPAEAARAYYDAHQDEFAQACVSHILVDTQEKADQVRNRIASGEEFGAVARAESKDTESSGRGGELGCDVTRDTGYVAEFQLAVFSQPVGELGQPVKTQFGFHVIKVSSRTVPPFDQITAEARQKLTKAGEQKVLTLLQEAVQKARIDINPKYGSFRKTGSSPAVVPPQGGGPVPSTPSTTP